MYHSGYEPDPDGEEGAYTPETRDRGVNRLVASLDDAGVQPGENVYAELGSTWFMMMRRPHEAAHVIGKLLKAVGEDRVVWGTDCIWYGSPQPLIDAFRAFTIPERMQEEFGYPALTPEIKDKILAAQRVRGLRHRSRPRPGGRHGRHPRLAHGRPRSNVGGAAMIDFALTEEHEMFRDTVHRWVEQEAPKSYARELEMQEGSFPHELWDKMTEAGFHGVGLPEEYGGSGADVFSQVILARELARSLGGLTWMWGIPSFCAKSVSYFGTDALKAKLLPELVSGVSRLAISVTEPGGGTDLLGAMKTTARRADGGWLVNGQKIWSSGAKEASHLLLLARTDTHEGSRARGVTSFLVNNPSDGLVVRHIPKVGMRGFGSCEVFLDDVFVPDDLVIGDVGNGFYQMLTTLNNERILVAALCVGIIDGVLEDAVDYAKQRMAFGKTIGSFQAVQHFLADIVMWQKQAELLTYYAAWKQQTGQPCGVESDMAKVQASEYAGKAADLGIQILGGMGYAAETDMQRYWRDARLYRIGPISSEMARNNIAESLGLPRSF